MTDDELLALCDQISDDFHTDDDLTNDEWERRQAIAIARAVLEAGRREGAETALADAADDIVFSDEWRNHGNNDPRLDGEAEASVWLESRIDALRALPVEVTE